MLRGDDKGDAPLPVLDCDYIFAKCNETYTTILKRNNLPLRKFSFLVAVLTCDRYFCHF